MTTARPAGGCCGRHGRGRASFPWALRPEPAAPPRGARPSRGWRRSRRCWSFGVGVRQPLQGVVVGVADDLQPLALEPVGLGGAHVEALGRAERLNETRAVSSGTNL